MKTIKIKNIRIRKVKGLTFVELLVSILIFSIIAASLYSCLRVGLLAYRKGEQLASLNQNVRLCLDSFSTDLRNSYKFSDKESGFVSENSKISFHCLKKVNFYSGQRIILPCRVEYFHARDSLERRIFSASASFADSAGVSPEVLLENVARIVFKFAYQEDNNPDVVWKDYWQQADKLPIALKVELEIMPAPGSRERVKFTKFINIALGSLGKDK